MINYEKSWTTIVVNTKIIDVTYMIIDISISISISSKVSAYCFQSPTTRRRRSCWVFHWFFSNRLSQSWCISNSDDNDYNNKNDWSNHTQTSRYTNQWWKTSTMRIGRGYSTDNKTCHWDKNTNKKNTHHHPKVFPCIGNCTVDFLNWIMKFLLTNDSIQMNWISRIKFCFATASWNKHRAQIKPNTK